MSEDSDCSTFGDKEEESPSNLKKFSIENIDEDSEPFYANGKAYWEQTPATVDGMLGGYECVSSADITASDAFLKSIFRMKPPPSHARVVDCGSGIGRITKNLLRRHFGKVDLVEQCEPFLEQAKTNLEECDNIGEFICSSLQDFSPEPSSYDVIWCQWVLTHLSDSDVKKFLERMIPCLKINGVIVVKENVSSSGEVELDENDSSLTRPLTFFLDVFKELGLKVKKNVKQNRFPKGLYEVRMLCLKP